MIKRIIEITVNTDGCGQQRCEFYAVCESLNGKPRCMCPTSCVQVFQFSFTKLLCFEIPREIRCWLSGFLTASVFCVGNTFVMLMFLSAMILSQAVF